MESGSVRVLIIDDNPEILEVLRLMLTQHAFTVEVRQRMDDFIAETKAVAPDIIIIDQHLGWAKGDLLCSSLKTEKRTAVLTCDSVFSLPQNKRAMFVLRSRCIPCKTF